MISEYTGQSLDGYDLAIPAHCNRQAVAKYMPTHLRLTKNAWFSDEGVAALEIAPYLKRFATFTPLVVHEGGNAIILYQYITKDRGLIPTWSLELSVFCHSMPLHCEQVLKAHKELLEHNGIRIVEQGRPDLVINLDGYVLPQRLKRNLKKAVGLETFCIRLRDVDPGVLQSLLAQTLYDYMEINYTPLADKYVCLEDFYTAQELFPTVVFATKYEGRIVALSLISIVDKDWCWLSTLRDQVWFNEFGRGLNFICAIVSQLIAAATLNGAATFNLGIDQYPYKQMFNPTLVWHPGLEYV